MYLHNFVITILSYNLYLSHTNRKPVNCFPALH